MKVFASKQKAIDYQHCLITVIDGKKTLILQAYKKKRKMIKTCMARLVRAEKVIIVSSQSGTTAIFKSPSKEFCFIWRGLHNKLIYNEHIICFIFVKHSSNTSCNVGII